ncbi:hypothetical protein [Limnovirga soli]|uniref:Uncharacterized protein n=1 Tax=Limnovirga soli TaxID=2656915 RepID=A0A8J8FJG7_9BACT|nr:hypothetical protein [Limnovirga soli]NNV57757.1 hypothetical protein [Limnovirga soli]
MASYNYHPKTTAKLGFPIDSRRPFEDKSTNGYLEWKSFSTDNKNIGAEVEFQIEEVTTREELYKKLSLDIKVEAKFGLTNASASLDWEKEVHFNEKNIIYVFNAKKLYIPENVNGVLEFSDKGKQFWKTSTKNKTIIEFQRVVGNEVVTSLQRGNNVTLIYSFNCISVEQKESVRAKLEVSWTTGNVNIDFESEYKQKNESLTIGVYGYQSGIGTTKLEPKLSEIIDTEPGNMPVIKEKIKDILGNISAENRESSPIMVYNTRQISDIFEISNSKFYSEFIDAIELNSVIDESCIKLSNLAFENLVNHEELSELNKVWNRADFKENSKEIIQQKLMELEAQRNLILKQFKLCINAKTENDCVIKINTVSVLNYSDVVVLPFILPLTWSNNTKADQEKHDSDFGTFTTTFYPTVHIKFPKAINSFYMIKNGVRINFFNKETVLQIQKNNGSFDGIWETKQVDFHVEVWAWHSVNVEQTRQNKNIEHIARELQNEYKLEIIMDDGTTHEVNIGNAGKPISLPKEYFSNVPQTILDSQFSGNNLKLV